MSENPIEEAIALSDEAKKPGTFSIVNVLKERAYPVDEVNVYLDEQAAYDAAKIQEKIDELVKSADAKDVDEAEKLSKKRDAIIKKLEESKYVFTISGLSEGKRDEIQDEATEKFPVEYDESKNPFTGEVIKTEKDNKQRDRYFTNLLWVSSVKKIVNNAGDVQENLTIEDVESLRSMLPIAASGAIIQSIEKLRISTAIFMSTVDEDFLAKS